METMSPLEKIKLLSAEQRLVVEKYADSLIEYENKKSVVAEPEVVYKTSKKIKPGFGDGKSAIAYIADDFGMPLNSGTPKLKRKFGSLKGFVKHIADDFDAPLNEFKEYI